LDLVSLNLVPLSTRTPTVERLGKGAFVSGGPALRDGLVGDEDLTEVDLFNRPPNRAAKNILKQGDRGEGALLVRGLRSLWLVVSLGLGGAAGSDEKLNVRSVNQSFLYDRVPTAEDVHGWQANVEHLLHGETELLQLFRWQPLTRTLGLSWASIADALQGGPEVRRLEGLLAQLDKVIERVSR
jgi:hypothetical protein